MRFTQSVTRSLAFAGVTAMVTLSIALAQPSKKPFEPQVGQPGKDVIWVPTPQALVEKMLDLTKVSPNDIHYDLGSGDGRTVIAAAKRGAKAFGVEYNPDMVALSRANAEKEKVSDTRHLHRRRHLQDRLLEGQRHHALSAHQPEREAAPDHPRDAAGHPRGVELVRHGRLAAGHDRQRLRRLPVLHRALLDGPGQGRPAPGSCRTASCDSSSATRCSTARP